MNKIMHLVNFQSKECELEKETNSNFDLNIMMHFEKVEIVNEQRKASNKT
jgi:hypothetical protein